MQFLLQNSYTHTNLTSTDTHNTVWITTNDHSLGVNNFLIACETICGAVRRLIVLRPDTTAKPLVIECEFVEVQSVELACNILHRALLGSSEVLVSRTQIQTTDYQVHESYDISEQKVQWSPSDNQSINPQLNDKTSAQDKQELDAMRSFVHQSLIFKPSYLF